MAFVQARFFLLSNGNEPPACQVDTITKVIAEVIIQSDWYDQGVGEEVNMLEIKVVQAGTNNCIKQFRWNGACALLAGSTYFVDTSNFSLPAGSYNILMGSSGKPLSRAIGECGINMSEVSC